MGFYYSDDPLRDHDLYERDRQEWLKSLPKCERCKEHIQDEEYYDIEGTIICCDCIEVYCAENYKKSNEYL